ncbi:hypothetical protein NA56DRAFT_703538 [Hyaloscypha hepaticicola]|uniref:Uncharacterized protein n=1 Tax=Hyaloscypha hepaticicola TaxID=2082293 RepID=A0A2J6Q4Y2_9HELO|nr:hypothetical protein NA56DRAFT_703538 [Hyaloscypha hepaticicola]
MQDGYLATGTIQASSGCTDELRAIFDVDGPKTILTPHCTNMNGFPRDKIRLGRMGLPVIECLSSNGYEVFPNRLLILVISLELSQRLRIDSSKFDIIMKDLVPMAQFFQNKDFFAASESVDGEASKFHISGLMDSGDIIITRQWWSVVFRV